jgi:hypothetical protein
MYLGESKHGLGDADDILHLANGVDTSLDSFGVRPAGRVEDIFESLGCGRTGLATVVSSPCIS